MRPFLFVIVAVIMTLLAAYPLVQAAEKIATAHVQRIQQAADVY